MKQLPGSDQDALMEYGPAAGSHTQPAPRAGSDNPLLFVHRCLRGRYLLAILLAVVFAVPAALIGYSVAPPKYTSVGIVRVAPTLPKFLFKTEEQAMPPLFESYVSAQASYLSSRRVLDLAVDSPELRDAGWPAAPEGIALLNKSLSVSNRSSVELISASVTHRNPALAQKAVNAVLKAYETLQDELSAVRVTEVEQTLVQRQRDLAREIESFRGQIADLASAYATDDLETLQQARLQEVLKLDGTLSGIDIQLAGKDPGDPNTVSPTLPDEMSADTLAARDPTLARLQDQRVAIQTQIDAESRRLGPGHRAIKDMIRQREAVEAQIADRVQIVRTSLKDGTNTTDVLAATGAMTFAQLKSLRERYVKLRDAAVATAMNIERARGAINTLKEQLDDRKKALEATSARLEELRVENKSIAAGRVSIVQRGDYPVEASSDRRLPLAFLGAMAGFGAGFGIIFLRGLLQGGYHYIDELETGPSNISLLGTVPDLKDADPDKEAMAALSIHHLRNMLQLQVGPRDRGSVFTITSASSGDGKTSIALALGMSFAATGSRTLLVDADLVGRGLTRQLNMQGVEGMCEAVKRGHVNGEVRASTVANMSILPAGLVQDYVPEHLSSRAVHHIIDALRDQYDAVVIDTGPVLGSLEANVVAPESDRVVLVVSKGQSSKLVNASIGRLQRLGARCAGLVFNRAGHQDFDRSISVTSISARSAKAASVSRRNQTGAGRNALIRAVGAGPRVDDRPMLDEPRPTGTDS